jgi:thiol-disulfide isomerase/thioredoxin
MNLMFRASWLAAVALLLTALAATVAASGQAAKLPRYKLQVGQELVYKREGEFNYEGGKFRDRATWHLWVVRTNKDGSWHLVIRHASVFSQGDAVNERETVTFAWCDLFPDGRLVENESFGFQMKPLTLLLRLPSDAEEAAKGWSAKDTRMDETYHYRLQAGTTPDQCVVEAKRESPMNEIYGFTFKDTLSFDTQRGFPDKIESENKQTYGFKGTGHATLKLEEVKTHDAAWTQAFAAEAERYFEAQTAYSKVTAKRDLAPADLKLALEKAAAGLKTAQADLKLAELQKQIETLLSEHEQFAKYYVEVAERRAAVLDKPAAEWSTVDLEGKPHALKDYRGKVVILDFWYRGCGWCVRAMPQMKQIATHFKDQPVAVIGMNTDRNEDDARFVIKKMGLNYTNLKAEGLPEKYKVQGFPTLLIIDQAGIVRDIHVGYSPQLREEVVGSVEKLLKAQQAQ